MHCSKADEGTYTNDCGIVMHIPSLRDWFINSEVFHFRSTEDDICVGFLHRWDVLVWGPR